MDYWRSGWVWARVPHSPQSWLDRAVGGRSVKNFERVLAVVDRSGALLFFDEADALFGKRTTVSDARDGYANMELSFLLQRLED